MKVSWELHLCRRRVLHLEDLIRQFLAAYDDSEAGNEQEVIAKFRRALEEI